MTDIHPPNIRSKNMSAIKSADTKPEKIVKSFLCNFGLRYRKFSNEFKFKPDFIFPGIKHVIFIHGCFWHRHQGCSRCSTPSQNKEYWSAKFKKNVDHDKSVYKELRRQNMNYLIFWECEIKQRTMMILEDKIVREIEKCREKLR